MSTGFFDQSYVKISSQYQQVYTNLPASAPTVDQFHEALSASYYAIIAAYSFAGNTPPTPAPIARILADTPKADSVSFTDSILLRLAITGLEFSCIANTGANFLPDQYGDILRAAAGSILHNIG